MSDDRLSAALNFVDDDLISEAADYRPKSPAKKTLRIGYIKYFASAAAVVLAGAAGLGIWKGIKFDGGVSIKNQSSPNADISAVIEQINKNKTELAVAALVEEFNSLRGKVDFSAKGGIGTFLGDGESSPGIRFSPVYGKNSPLLSEWKESTHNVVWNSLDTDWNVPEDLWKDDSFTDDPKLGEVKMSPTLYTLITRDTLKDPYYAVKVNFRCIDEKEMLNWKYKGATIDVLEDAMIKAGKLGDEEMQSYFQEYIQEAIRDFYLVKMQQFYETFQSQHLEIYPSEYFYDYGWFYCFMDAGEIASFTCKFDEAFYLDLAYKYNE